MKLSRLANKIVSCKDRREPQEACRAAPDSSGSRSYTDKSFIFFL